MAYNMKVQEILADKLIPKVITDQAPHIDKLERLLNIEGVALQAKDRRALRHIAVNSTREVVPYGHAIFFTRKSISTTKNYQWRVKSISSHGVIDRTSPFVQWVEEYINKINTVQNCKKEDDDREGVSLTKIEMLSTADNEGSLSEATYPFKKGLWIELSDAIGILYTRDEEWHDGECQILERLSNLYACVWNALGFQATREKFKPLQKRLWKISALAITIIALWPVSMTTLAPAEIVASQPEIVSAPINGVIDNIHILPNTYVKKGDVIATYVDTVLRNEYALAVEETEIAKARLERTRLVSFGDAQARREIKIVETEYKLAERRRDYAFENLDRTTLYAQSNGLLIYSDRDEWAGRPVNVGERIATIAQPDNIELKIEAPIGDGRLLKTDAKVRLFLDSDPLKSVKAVLKYTSYYPEPSPGGGLAYIATARLVESNQNNNYNPRIGARGVAKIYGEKAPLGLWIMRRPIVSIRQFLGL